MPIKSVNNRKELTVIIDHIAFIKAKQGDNAFDSLCTTVGLFFCALLADSFDLGP